MPKGQSTKAKPPENETKSDKFLRIAQPRVGSAVVAIRRLHALGGSAYESTQEQRDKVMSSLRAEIAALEKAWTPRDTSKAKDTAFSF